ncbi:E3 ubiquitin-protein ligase ZNF598 [Arctopsyche grandis]|uniref:E3 ubiquitin-protein ligase ZNF598 n=1 Tax=Arctopsyche grandis TaxID=121162 RepID=UPI00406D9ECA
MSSTEGDCVVCFKPVDVLSVGECDHPVCFECSTRMRVLCLQDECPICRHHLDKVVFTPDCQPFKSISASSFNHSLYDRSFKIGFVNETIKSAYLKLLEHSCRKCGKSTPPFESFDALKDHMRVKHDLFFCELCVTNLKIFTGERKYYTKAQLALHRRKGDPDDSSHKGHPLCQFCDTRFMDTDELYRHLRKHHLYCHLCDADGFDHYYGSYSCLRDHFRKEHYLCEEGECSELNLTAVFRSDIDLKAHKACEHGRGLSKQAARQARTLELQFTLTPRPRGPPPMNVRPERVEEEQIREAIREDYPRNGTTVSIDTGSKEQFPSLGVTPTGPVLTMRPQAMVVRQSSGALVKTEQNFPTLGGDSGGSGTPTVRVNITHQPSVSAGPSNAIIKSTAKPNVSIQLHNRPTSASQFKISEAPKQHKQITSRPKSELRSVDETKRFEEEFPSLSKRDKSLLMNDYSSTVSMNNSLAKKLGSAAPVRVVPIAPVAIVSQPKAPPPPTSNAFPALCPSKSSQSLSQPQWIVPVKAEKKERLKQLKVAPAPQIPSVSDLNNTQDFPSLVSNSRSKSKKGNKSETQRQVEDNSKKEKKKVLKITDDVKVNNTPENTRKTVPPDSMYEKKLKEALLGAESKRKSDPESTWVEWKGKKNHMNGKVEEQCVNFEKLKLNSNSAPSKKIIEPPVLDDFPALNAGKGIPGFRNAKNESILASNTNKVTLSENAKNKLSYSENLKIKNVINNKVNNNNDADNDKCKQSDFIGSPASVFHGSVPPCNGFTFTNSSGQSYNIPVHNYLEPPNFNQRNKALVVNFMKAMCSKESILEFKEVSRQFREGVYSAEAYYEHCRGSIKEEFEVLFPELLALLPDISKQRELHKIYSDITECNLEVCSTCGQILLPNDAESHVASHSLLTHFPALGAPVQATPVWRK